MLRSLGKCCSVIGLLFICGALHAQPRQLQSLAAMDHKTWTGRDGAPQNIRALVQAADGTLWIGADSGLFNFDGRTFSAFESPEGEPELPVDAVSSLCFTRDGSLWIGYLDAGVARIRQGHVTLYATTGEHRLFVIRALREARDGSIWGASGQTQIIRFGADDRWHEEPTPTGTDDRLFAFLDSTDILWVAQRGRLYRRDIREPPYTETNVPADWLFGFAEAGDGTFWISDYDGTHAESRLQHVDRLGQLIAKVSGVEDTAADIAYRADGSLVYASQFDGLRLFSSSALNGAGATTAGSASPEAFTQREGLTSNGSSALLHDADGSLWVGTAAGLDRFKPGLFIPFGGERKSDSWSVCANDHGEVWVADRGGAVYRVAHGKRTAFSQPGGVFDLFCGNDGYTWLVARDGVWSVHGDQIKLLPPIPGQDSYGIRSVVVTDDRTLFAKVGGSGSGGIWQYKDGQWTAFVSPALLDRQNLGMYLDRQDRLWLGLNDEVALPTTTRVDRLVAPGMGLINAFLETRHGFFAAGAGGLAVLRGSQFETLAFEDRTFTRGMNGLVEAGNGDLWINASRGLVRVPQRELEAALATRGYRMKSEHVAEGDFNGVSVTFYSFATAARDAGGQLWFVSRSGVFHFDPEHHISDTRPPIVSIRSIAADRTPLGAAGTFAPRPQTVEIRYFGAHLADPDRVTYRYRLAGLEDAWRDAGQRTEATYTHLGPGTYTFQVMASSGNDVWTEPLSSKSFTVLRSFYQTTWFRVLCIVATLALILAIITLRVRALTRGIRARAEERADERIRIARELHDTLLQGVQGLLLNFHVAAQKLARDAESRAMLERTLSSADKIILEGRNRVSSLRSEQLTDGELVAAIENVGKDLRADGDVQFTVTRAGSASPLAQHVADEIFWIAREALTNAFRHAAASCISVELNCGRRYFRMVVADNGRGFDTNNGDKQGHWGLRGMAERTRKLGGQLRVQSDSTSGTQIVATVPSYRAYKNRSRAMFYLLYLFYLRADRL